MQYINVHTHIFTVNNTPKDFLKLFVSPLAAMLIENGSNTQVGSWLVQQLARLSGNSNIKRYANFLKIGKSKNQMEVFEDLIAQYTDDSNIQFVGLSLYMEKLGAGDSMSRFEGQLEESLAVKRRYGNRLLLFLGVDPRWKSSGTELRKSIEDYFETKLSTGEGEVYPFCGIKLYPSTGYYIFDPRLKETLEWAADNGVPVLTHCSYLGGLYNNDSQYLQSYLKLTDPYTGKPYPGIYLPHKKANTANSNSCSYLIEPESYRSVLDHFKNKNTPLKLNLAHFGGNKQIHAAISPEKSTGEQRNPYGILHTNWFTQIQNLMKEFDSVYTDISYTLFDKELHSTIISETMNAQYGHRLLYGTDYYMTERENAERNLYSEFKKTAIAATTGNGGTVWDKIAGENVANFLRSKYYP